MSKLLLKAKINLERAEDAYKRMSIDELYRDECCYQIQQAIEKSLKYVLEVNKISYKFKHSLKPLIDIVENLSIKVPNDIKDKVDMLDSWESESRYNDNFYALKKDIEIEIQATSILIKEIEDKANKPPITGENLELKLKALFPNREDIDNLINEINSCIPPAVLNKYGHNKLERVFNFANKYKDIIGDR